MCEQSAKLAHSPEKHQVRRAFSRAAFGYDGVAHLQREVADKLIQNLPQLVPTARVVDVGTGTGYCAACLRVVYPHAQLVGLDLAEGMLRKAMERPGLNDGWRPVCADAEAMPFKEGSIDLLVSNLALQWCADLPRVLSEMERVLAPGGYMSFTTFGEATLRELRMAWARVDDYSHVNTFVSHGRLPEMLAEAGFSAIRVSNWQRVLEYPDVWSLMRELKRLGAHNVTARRRRHLTGKGRLQTMMATYRSLMGDERTRATFEIIQVSASKSARFF